MIAPLPPEIPVSRPVEEAGTAMRLRSLSRGPRWAAWTLVMVLLLVFAAFLVLSAPMQ